MSVSKSVRLLSADWIDEAGLLALAQEAMAGRTQLSVAQALGITPPAVSQALRAATPKHRAVQIAIIEQFHPSVSIAGHTTLWLTKKKSPSDK